MKESIQNLDRNDQIILPKYMYNIDKLDQVHFLLLKQASLLNCDLIIDKSYKRYQMKAIMKIRTPHYLSSKDKYAKINGYNIGGSTVFLKVIKSNFYIPQPKIKILSVKKGDKVELKSERIGTIIKYSSNAEITLKMYHGEEIIVNKNEIKGIYKTKEQIKSEEQSIN